MTQRHHRPGRTLLRGVAAFAALAVLSAPALAADPMDGVYACTALGDDAARLSCFDRAIAGLRQAEASGEIVTVTREEVVEVERDAFGFSLPSLPRLGRLFGGGGGDASTPTPARAADLTPRGDKLTAPVVTPTPMPAPTPTPAPSPVRTADATRPAVRPQAPAFEEIKSITQPLARTKEFGVEKTRFYLANGQVWDQVDTSKVRIPRERDGNTNFVEVRKGALGSFLLQVNGKGRAIRVQRRR